MIHGVQEVETGVHKTSCGVRGVCDVLAGGVRGEKQIQRQMDGVRLGAKCESGESIVGAADGVGKARDFRRKPEEGGRWINDGIDGLNCEP